MFTQYQPLLPTFFFSSAEPESATSTHALTLESQCTLQEKFS